jgi:hypothetical protein
VVIGEGTKIMTVASDPAVSRKEVQKIAKDLKSDVGVLPLKKEKEKELEKQQKSKVNYQLETGKDFEV